MKYLKLFEQHDQDEYYKKVDSETFWDDFMKLVENNGFQNFEKYEIDLIDKSLPPDKISEYPKQIRSEWHGKNSGKVPGHHYVTERVPKIDNTSVELEIHHKIYPKDLRDRASKVAHIYKFGDDWFLVDVSTFGNENYYKCDQLDGLIKLLKDIL